MSEPITTSSDWNFELIEKFYKEIETIAVEELGLDVYPNQIEVISAEQMLDAYCITPDHKLLKQDLSWIEAGNIKVGDVVLGFDEHGPHRRYRSAIVQGAERVTKPVYCVTLSSGKQFKVTGNHLWLVRQQKGATSVLQWRATTQLRTTKDTRFSASRIPKLMDVWSEINTKDAGWLAGMYDGEGNIIRGSVQALCISQNEGPTLNKIKQIIGELGYTFYQADKKSGRGICKTIGLTGSSSADQLRFLGEIRPERIISKISFDQLGLMKTSNYEEVESVQLIGDLEIVKITTSTGTFVCDGYPMHNSSVGMPIMYNHWSFGKDFITNNNGYKQGQMGLAYEIVLNTNPCLVYLMEENTMMMQALVIAHAAFGHNAFFKNNYLFKEWTQADTIVDYLVFAKHYISECEEKYGVQQVESLLDACHALQNYGVDKYHRSGKLSVEKERAKQNERAIYVQSQLNDLWRTIPGSQDVVVDKGTNDVFPAEPQENILYFLEKHSPNLETWQREIIRIVRKIAQYFHPQRATKVMNEGFATFIHYTIMQRLREKGLITDGFMMEFLRDHTNVVMQPSFESKYFSGLNPYALGFAMFQDIRRICENPTEEDKRWFPEWAGDPDWISVVKRAVVNFKDDGFILQFLSPTVMRNMKMFSLKDSRNEHNYEVTAIHNDEGFKHIRRVLSEQHNPSLLIPDIQVVGVDKWGTRRLLLQHNIVDGKLLDAKQADRVVSLIHTLWKYDVVLCSVDDRGQVKATHYSS
jgi:stage V sporulation protein R